MAMQPHKGGSMTTTWQTLDQKLDWNENLLIKSLISNKYQYDSRMDKGKIYNYWKNT